MPCSARRAYQPTLAEIYPCGDHPRRADWFQEPQFGQFKPRVADAILINRLGNVNYPDVQLSRIQHLCYIEMEYPLVEPGMQLRCVTDACATRTCSLGTSVKPHLGACTRVICQNLRENGEQSIRSSPTDPVCPEVELSHFT